jgi:hypothetical protein
VKIDAVNVPAAASNPSHPDHARWVKEQTLKIEAAHAPSFRAAEIENTRQLERLAQRKRKPKAPKKPRIDTTAEQLAAAGVTKRVAKPRRLAPLPPCGLCRKCVWCKRSLRMSQIARRAREQDIKARALMDEITAIAFAAMSRKDYRDALGRELPFSRIVGIDVDKAVTQGIEWVCDRSTSFMGPWL